jgi:hypothetical protein
MYHMLSWFDLKDGHTINQFKHDYDSLVTRLLEQDLIVSTGPLGLREPDSNLDTDEERKQRYFSIMSFRDREQSEAAYEEILRSVGPAIEPHNDMMSAVKEPIFLFWRDLD